MHLLQPFPTRQVLDSSKQKEFADDNIKFDENGRKFSRQVENTVGRGEIARYEQFLLITPNGEPDKQNLLHSIEEKSL